MRLMFVRFAHLPDESSFDIFAGVEVLESTESLQCSLSE